LSRVFFPVDPLFEEVVAAWISELGTLGFGSDDPLFPATEVAQGADRKFVPVGLSREYWRSANAIRRIFRSAFEGAGMPYFNPHSFRKTLAIHGERICRTAEEWRAYSLNFGHSSPMTTYESYGPVAPHRQAEILNMLARRGTSNAGRIDLNSLSSEEIRDLLNGLANRLAGASKRGKSSE
jgi:integrase